MNRSIDASAISIGKFLDISSQAVIRTRFEEVKGEDFVRAASQQDALLKVLRKVDKEVFSFSWGDLSGTPHWTGDPSNASMSLAHYGNPPVIPNTNRTQLYPNLNAANDGTGGGGIYYSRKTEDILGTRYLTADNSGAITSSLREIISGVQPINYFNISSDGSVCIASSDGLSFGGIQFDNRQGLLNEQQLTKPFAVYSGHWGQAYSGALSGTQPPLKTRIVWSDISGNYRVKVAQDNSTNALEKAFRPNLMNLGYTGTAVPVAVTNFRSVGPCKFFASSADCMTFVYATWFCSTSAPVGGSTENPKFELKVKKAVGADGITHPPTREERENGQCVWLDKGGVINGPNIKLTAASDWHGLECPNTLDYNILRITGAEIIKLINISNFLAMSGDGNVIAWRQPIDTVLRGEISAFKYNGTVWATYGDIIKGPISGSVTYTGNANNFVSNGSLSLDEKGTRLIAGGDVDQVCVYSYASISNTWLLLQTIKSQAEYPLWKSSISLDGSFICLSSRNSTPGNLGSDESAEVKFFQFDLSHTNNYVQMGTTVTGNIYDSKISSDSKYVVVADKVQLDNISGNGIITTTEGKLGNGDNINNTPKPGEDPDKSIIFLNDGEPGGGNFGLTSDVSAKEFGFPFPGSALVQNPQAERYICTLHREAGGTPPTNKDPVIKNTYYSGVKMAGFEHDSGVNTAPFGVGLIMAFRFDLSTTPPTLTDCYVQSGGSGFRAGDVVRPKIGSFGETFGSYLDNANDPLGVNTSPSVGPYFKFVSGGTHDAFDGQTPFDTTNNAQYDGVHLKGSVYKKDAANGSWDIIGMKSEITGRVYGGVTGNNITSIGDTNVDISNEISNLDFASISANDSTDTSFPITGPRVVMGNYGIKDLRETIATGTAVTFI